MTNFSYIELFFFNLGLFPYKRLELLIDLIVTNRKPDPSMLSRTAFPKEVVDVNGS